MRILHYIDLVRDSIGGPARAVVDLCRVLASRGHEVTIATDDDEAVPASWKDGSSKNPRSFRMPSRMNAKGQTLGPLRPMHEMRALVDQAEVVHIHGVWEPTKPRVASVCRSAGAPYVVSLRGQLDDWCMEQGAAKKRLFMMLFGRRMLERAAFVHCTAEAERTQSSKHFPNGRGIVVPNLLDLKPFETLPGAEVAAGRFPALRSERPRLLFLSRIHVKKGLESLLEAVALLGRRGVECELFIAGTGDSSYVDRMKGLARELGIEGRAHFVGLVINQEKLSLYQACDLFVLPTSQENFGFVFVESLACGTPVVTTKGVDIWPELEQSGGALIAEGDAESVSLAVESLLTKRASLPEMGRRGREWVFRDLHPDRVIRQFERMYEEAIASRAR